MLKDIWKHGLLTKADRSQKGTAESVFAAVSGDGVYTGDNPESFYQFRHHAMEGMMVLCLMSLIDINSPSFTVPSLMLFGQKLCTPKQDGLQR